MTDRLPAALTAQLPPTTPLTACSMPPQERDRHRKVISASVETVLEGYWRDDLSQAKRALILADWADELEDWPVDKIRHALREHRREFPNKKPNPGHIIQRLSRAWGEAHADQVRRAMSDARPVELDRTDPEHRKAICAELATRFPHLVREIPKASE